METLYRGCNTEACAASKSVERQVRGRRTPAARGSRIEISDARMKQTTYTGNPAILSCWKDIARYLGKGVRTVQRWEREFDLPVRRPRGADRKSAVAADPRDLDAWLASRWSLRTDRKRSDGRDNNTIATEMNRRIETARLLRERQGTLVRELSATMQTLSQNCRRLANGESTVSLRLETSRLSRSEFPSVTYLPALTDPRQRAAGKEPGSGDGLQSISQTRSA
jgi:hypothetical protein